MNQTQILLREFIVQLEPFFFLSRVPLSLATNTLSWVLITSHHDGWQGLLLGFHPFPSFHLPIRCIYSWSLRGRNK